MSNLNLPEAFEELLQPFRYKVYYGGRGGAKSWAFADVLLIEGSTQKLRILCAREIQTSIRDSVHKLISDRIGALDMDYFYKVQNDSIKGINGTEFIFKGLKHNVQEIKSTEGIDKCWVEEAEKVSERSWEILIPTIRKEGSEIWISFNPKNPTDPTYKRFVQTPHPDSIVKKVSWRDNPFFPEVLRLEKDRLKIQDPEAYQHIWEGEFDTRYSGAIYAKQVAKAYEDGRVRENLYDPELPVHTSWDLGFSDATAVWFYQLVGGEVHFIDYWEDTGRDVSQCCEALYGKSIIIKDLSPDTSAVTKWELGEPNEFAHRQAYKYHIHNQPHDAAYKLQAARGRSFAQQCYEFGVRAVVIQPTNQETAIQATRKLFPQFWFDSKRCADGLNVLVNYSFDYDEDHQTLRKIPKHDWASHGSKALEIVGRTNINNVKEPDPPQKARFLHETTVNELFWGQNDGNMRQRERI